MGLLWQLDWQVVCSCVWGMGSRVVFQECCLRGRCFTLVTRVSGGCLAINTVGLLKNSTNNRIGVCVAGCKFVPSLPPCVRFRLVFCLLFH